MLRSSKKRVMTLGSGIDIVKIQRFERWGNYHDKTLLRVFHPQEVIQFRKLFLENSAKAVQFLASRFAVKEAFYKAFCDFKKSEKHPKKSIIFLELARGTHIIYLKNVPVFPKDVVLKWIETNEVISSVSISHESCCVVASVTLLKMR